MTMPDVVVWIMVIMVSLVVGFLIGWLLEYYLDLKYWEMRAKKRGLVFTEGEITSYLAVAPPSTNAESAEANKELNTTLQEFLEKREQEITVLRGEMEKQETQYDDLERQFEQYMATHPDDLTAIRGIGRIYQWKLRDAGISSYEHLINTTPERLREILEVQAWRKFEPEVWIEQAKVLSRRGE